MSNKADESQRNKYTQWTIWALSVLLNVGLLLYIYKEKHDNKTKDGIILAKTEQVLNVKSKLDSISMQLDQRIGDLQDLGANVDSLVIMRQQLEKDKLELKDLESFSSLSYDEKIKAYEQVLVKKGEEIVVLKEELGETSEEKDELSQKLAELEAIRKQLAAQVKTYTVQNTELTKQVDIAIVLKTTNIEVEAVSSRGKVKEGGVYKARKIDQLKVTFNLVKNDLAKKEKKMIFLRLLDPDGALLSDEATGSPGFKANGQVLASSASGSIDYSNTGQQVEIVYGRGGKPLKSGPYTVEIYAEGHKIGESSFEVK